MTATFYVGDAIEVMGKLPEKSVDLVLTSPPFLALRSYLPADHPDKALEGGSQATPGEYIDWLLDVVEACERVLAPHGSLVFELGDTYSGSGGGGGDYLEGGWREGQAQFAGSAASMKESNAAHWRQKNAWRANTAADDREPLGGRAKRSGRGSDWPLAKSLSLIPETFRFAMVYGVNPHTGRHTAPWRLRNVIRWVRPNPPVGALGDKFRPATSELMVFCKAKDRFFDLDAVREPFKGDGTGGGGAASRDNGRLIGVRRFEETFNTHAGAPPLDWWESPSLSSDDGVIWWCKVHRAAESAEEGICEVAARILLVPGPYPKDDYPEACDIGRRFNLNPIPDTDSYSPLDWWNIPPGGFEGAHYAVWPKELLIKPIKAMCPEKVCRQCGEPSRRIVGEAEYVNAKNGAPRADKGGIRRGQGIYEGNREVADGTDQSVLRVAETLGFSDCLHDTWRPGVVLDPFAGSGTTLAVATGHGRDAIGIDLDERNYDLALDRVGPFILERAG